MKLLAIKKMLNDMKLRNKLFFSFVFVVFVPVMIVGGYLTNELKQLALTDAVKQETANLDRVRKRTLETLKIPLYLSNNILYDQRLKEIVNTEYQYTYDVVAAYKNYSTFDHYLKTYPQEISSIRFYMENPTLLNNWQIIPITEKMVKSVWYTNAKKGKGLANWTYIEDETKQNRKYISLVRRIDFLDFKTYGMLVISVNPDHLDLILSQESSPMMLIDDKNNIIATNHSEFTTKSFSKMIDSKQKLEEPIGTFRGKVNGEPSYIFIEEISPDHSSNGLRVVSVIPNKEIVENANHLGRMGLFVVTISVLIALCLIYYFSKWLSERILTLSKQINEVGKGNFDHTILVDGKDEIGQLSKQLNMMAKNTKQLLQEIEESNKQKSLMEQKQNHIKFKMMASQINPHFLFNALESIRMRASLNGEREIAQVVKLLGKLMRNSIEVGTGKVKLSSEISVIQSYLEIQKFRYRERIHYTLHIDPRTNDLEIPPLIIQPLVENAVIHGIEDVATGGEISVTSKWTSVGVYIAVMDSGKGIDEERLKKIKQMLAENEEKEGIRIGLRNVHQRLLLTYGESAGLEIESVLDKGTTISFLIPLERGKEIV
ncbi:two-component system sensor histidine kinase YesM [Lederbergia galactosidilyticus]|uniref:sensor histidine kinase n=1 Tax=Lederbergia galactosidilytica TaxID=217031 RepID=UPI001AE671A3|nr:sensor histidine kinase [Lederbergia galactosidilytica]MBP1913329.1 two-component system sensor histidine kinase YesM [Lederbergia galactosidilytica]